MAEGNDLGKCSCGMQPNVAALLSYLLGWISGLIFFLIEKENKFVRFHAMQSLMLFGGLTVIAIIPFVNLLVIILGPLSFVLWIILMIKAYQGQMFKLPLVGDLAEKNS